MARNGTDIADVASACARVLLHHAPKSNLARPRTSSPSSPGGTIVTGGTVRGTSTKGLPIQAYTNLQRDAGSSPRQRVEQTPEVHREDNSQMARLLQQCTQALNLAVPGSVLYTTTGKKVHRVAELRNDQVVFVACPGEAFGRADQSGPPTTPTEALGVAPTYGAFVYRMGWSEDDPRRKRVLMPPAKSSSGAGVDQRQCDAFLDQVGTALRLPNSARALYAADGTRVTHFTVTIDPNGHRDWPNLWVSMGEPFRPPDNTAVEVRQIKRSIKQMERQLSMASGDNRMELAADLSALKRKLQTLSDQQATSGAIVPRPGTASGSDLTKTLGGKCGSDLAKPTIRCITVKARWMGENMAVGVYVGERLQ